MHVTYALKIEATLEKSGDYAVEHKATLPEFFDWAKDQTRYLTVLIKEGATEPKPVRATITVKSVTVTE
jgi:hypothetical protein